MPVSTENNIAWENSFGYIKDDKIFLKPFLSFPEREIGMVKESAEDTIHYFENRYDLFVKKVEELFQAIEAAENKGSFLQKLLHLKELCGSYEGLGDFTSIFKSLEEKEQFLNELIAKNRIKNLAQKRALLEELDQIKDSNDWLNTAEKIKEVKNKWIRIGSVEKIAEEEIESMFKAYIDSFFKRRQEFYDERNKMNEIKLQKYEELATRAEAIKGSVDIKKTIDEFKKLNEEWKKVGPIPKKDLESVIKRYKASNDEFFKRIKELKKQKQAAIGVIPFTANRIERFIKLNEEVEKILKEMPPYGDETVKKLQEEWRKSPPVRTDEFKKIESTFRSACTKVLDIYFLNRISFKRNPGINKLPLKDQLKIKIGVLKELIIRDTEQIENFENSFSKLEVNSQNNSFDKVFGSKLYSQKKNLLSKQNLLKELEDKLLNLD